MRFMNLSLKCLFLPQRRAQVSEVDVYPALMPEFCLSSFSVDALRPYSDALPPPPPPCHEPAYAPTAPGAVLFDGPAEFEFNEELDVGDSITVSVLSSLFFIVRKALWFPESVLVNFDLSRSCSDSKILNFTKLINIK